MRARREHLAPLPGIVRLRLVAADEATNQRLLDVLAGHFTVTEPATYSGGRIYVDVDTRTTPPTPPAPGAAR